ncbi:hypothetical protein [uncultured Fibrella sp.]|uniref:hypothetical protein n=1 Tax=uncultured Fibrella sp. TaxID=1284596 RepID=UPI0035CC7F66
MEDPIEDGTEPVIEKVKAASRRTKKSGVGSHLQEPPKRGRGRPKKSSEEKSGYSHVLFKTNLFKPTTLEESGRLTDEQRQQRLATYMTKLREVVKEEAACEYYWRLVFTAVFHLYRSRKQTAAMAAGAASPPSILPSDLAEEAGMEYFNLRNLFSGRGTAKNVFCLLRFLYEQAIDFNQVQYNENIIDRAYTFLTVLKQEGIDSEEVKRLFYK